MNIEWFSTCKKSSELNQVQRTFGPSGATRTHDIQLPNLCLNFQRGVLRPLWHFLALLQFLFGTLLPCLFQPPLSAFGICVGLNSVY